MLKEESESREEDDLWLPRLAPPVAPTAPMILSKEGLEVLGASFCCEPLLSWMPPVAVSILLRPPWAALPGPMVA